LAPSFKPTAAHRAHKDPLRHSCTKANARLWLCHRNANLIGQRQRYFPIMGHENRGDADLTRNALHLDLHIDAQGFIEGRQWRVQQKHLRFGDDGLRQGHRLTLAARQLMRLAGSKVAQSNKVQRCAPAPSLG
jgi:hypothetical protein